MTMTGKKRMILAYSIMLGSIVVSANATVIALHYTNNNNSSSDNNEQQKVSKTPKLLEQKNSK